MPLLPIEVPLAQEILAGKSVGDTFRSRDACPSRVQRAVAAVLAKLVRMGVLGTESTTTRHPRARGYGPGSGNSRIASKTVKIYMVRTTELPGDVE